MLTTLIVVKESWKLERDKCNTLEAVEMGKMEHSCGWMHCGLCEQERHVDDHSDWNLRQAWNRFSCDSSDRRQEYDLHAARGWPCGVLVWHVDECHTTSLPSRENLARVRICVYHVSTSFWQLIRCTTFLRLPHARTDIVLKHLLCYDIDGVSAHMHLDAFSPFVVYIQA